MNDLPSSCEDLKQAKLLGEALASEELIKNACK